MSDNSMKYYFNRYVTALKQIGADISGEAKPVRQKSTAASRKHPKSNIVSEAETEIALASVKKQLGHKNTRRPPEKKQAGIHRKYTGTVRFIQYAIAAAILFAAIGTGYYIMPVTTVVPKGEIMTKALSDGSIVTLNSGTRISYNRMFGKFHRDITLDGEAYFNIASAENRFRVRANETVTEVTGTRFNIRSWSSDPGTVTKVTVSEGSVLFYSSDSERDKVELSGGTFSLIEKKRGIPEQPGTAELDNILAWKDRNLAFTSQPLGVIFSELERRFDKTIEIENEQISGEYLTAFYTKPDSLENLINDICTVKGLKYARTANGFRVFM